MKKLMYFAAALLVLVGCNKNDNIVENAPEGTPFEKGQKVTLTIGTGAQQGPNRVAGVDNTADNKIDFTWEEGDQILVKVGENTATFTLSSGAGLNEGEFAGVMPAGGSTFDIQYPTALDLTAQEYTTEKAIPADKMLFTATGCVLGTPAILKAQYAMLQLNLYGTDMTIGKIVFKNITSEPVESYTLTLPEGGVEISANSEEATPFYMVVPAGEYQFKVEVYDNAETPAMICSFATSEAKTFVAGDCLNMPAKEVKADPYNSHEYVNLGLSVKWATMNVGATAPTEFGDFLAWGETEPYYIKPITNPITWKEGKTNGYAWSSYCGGSSSFVEWDPAPYDATTKNLKPEYDAARQNWQGAWRTPTKAEWEELMNKENCEWKWCDGETEKYNNTTVKGYLVTSLKEGYTGNSIFLPASGFLTSKNNFINNGQGNYWSSSLYENTGSAYYYYFSSNKITPMKIDYYGRCVGLSVRPVCPIN